MHILSAITNMNCKSRGKDEETMLDSWTLTRTGALLCRSITSWNLADLPLSLPICLLAGFELQVRAGRSSSPARLPQDVEPQRLLST
jgi:hypothetical protein